MKLENLHLDFSQQYLQATLIVSLLSVWVLVGLFYYLNRYTKREYFTIWTVAWLFYALWLTLGLTMQGTISNKVIFMLRQCCVAISAVFLLWGSARFLSLPVRQTLLTLVHAVPAGLDVRQPASAFRHPANPTARFHPDRPRQRVCRCLFFPGAKENAVRRSGHVVAWASCCGAFISRATPSPSEYQNLYNAGFLIAAVLQLFIAVSMIVLVMEEVRYNAEQMRAEIAELFAPKRRRCRSKSSPPRNNAAVFMTRCA